MLFRSASELIKWTIELDDCAKKHPHLLAEIDDKNEISVFKSELSSLYQSFSENQFKPQKGKEILHFSEVLGLSQKEYESFMAILKIQNYFDENNKWIKDNNTKWFLSFREVLIKKGYKHSNPFFMAKSISETFGYKTHNNRFPINATRNPSDYNLIREFESKIPSRDSL